MLTQMNGFRILGIRESIVYLQHKLKFNKLRIMFNKTPEQQQAIRNTIKLKMEGRETLTMSEIQLLTDARDNIDTIITLENKRNTHKNLLND